jgi:hypothetical protein
MAYSSIMKMEAEPSSETPADFYQTALRNISQDEVLTAVTMFLDVTPDSLVEAHLL